MSFCNEEEHTVHLLDKSFYEHAQAARKMHTKKAGPFITGWLSYQGHQCLKQACSSTNKFKSAYRGLLNPEPSDNG